MKGPLPHKSISHRSPVQDRKAELRLLYRKRYQQFRQSRKAAQEAALIRDHFLRFLRKNSFKRILLYESLKSEIPLLDFLTDSSMVNKPEVYVPLIIGNGFLCRRYNSRRVTDISRIDCVFLPGLLGDLYGRRLGRGGGYYDRMIISVPRQRRVYTLRSFQFVDDIPVEQFDEPAGILITPEGVNRFL